MKILLEANNSLYKRTLYIWLHSDLFFNILYLISIIIMAPILFKGCFGHYHFCYRQCFRLRLRSIGTSHFWFFFAIFADWILWCWSLPSICGVSRKQGMRWLSWRKGLKLGDSSFARSCKDSGWGQWVYLFHWGRCKGTSISMPWCHYRICSYCLRKIFLERSLLEFLKCL